MSYDVSIGEQYFNYTSNVAKLFYDHMPPDEASDKGGIHTIDGCTGRAAARKLELVICRIDDTRHRLWESGVIGEPVFCHQYDAPNGWGSAIGGILFLNSIMAACHANPRKRVRVSA